jgi:predicted nucleic acid-binding protein
LVKFFSREEGWDRVEEVILEGVMSLDLSFKEVVNALWKKVLNEEMKAKDAEEIIEGLTKPEVIKTLNQNDYMLGAFKIAVENKITIYDALFIELAKSTNNDLVTSDSKQAEIARKEGVKIKIL